MTVRLWENDAVSPTLSHAARLAEWLGLTVEEVAVLSASRRSHARQSPETSWHPGVVAAVEPQVQKARDAQEIEMLVRRTHNPATDGWSYLFALNEALCNPDYCRTPLDDFVGVARETGRDGFAATRGT